MGFIIGFGWLRIGFIDSIGIGCGYFEQLVSYSASDVVSSSLLFRAGLLMVGGVFLFIGDILYK